MARIRTIKPSFFTSDDVCALSPLARLLFIGLWCEADREGRLEWKPRTFKRMYLPDDDCDADAVASELVARGVIVLYGQGLAYIPSFKKHQLFNAHEAKSKLPDPPECTDTHVHAHALPETHVGKGKEGEGKGKDSDPIGSGADAPQVDPVKILFDEGVKLLTENGCKEANARTLIGKWRKEQGDEATQAAFKAARAEGITEPIAWITQRFAGKPRENWNERRIRLGMEAIRDDRH